jgi:succinate dehydrogenase/fumarate reductase cytochrome b subunit
MCESITSLTTLIQFASCILAKGIIPLLVSVAVVAFIYGIIQFFLNPENEEKRKAGKSYMLWGIIALFVMVSFWGLVGILASTFTPGGTPNTVKIPGLPTQQ